MRVPEPATRDFYREKQEPRGLYVTIQARIMVEPGPPISREKFWWENSNELNCENSNELKFIVPGIPVTGDPSPRDPSSHCSHQSRQSIQEDDLDLESFGKKKKKKKRAGEGMAIEDAADDDKENGRKHNIAAELLTIVGQPGRLIDSKIMVELNILVVIPCHDHAVVVNRPKNRLESIVDHSRVQKSGRDHDR